MARPTRSGELKRSRQQGATYLLVLFIVAAMGLWLAATGEVWSTVSRREREQALLDTGHAYRDAIRRYYEQSPGTVKRYPPQLKELALDTRFLQTKRHLRKLYRDPMTGYDDWGVVAAPDGGIMGVYSQSEEAPIKTAGFSFADAGFEKASRYADWTFAYVPLVDCGAPESGCRQSH